MDLFLPFTGFLETWFVGRQRYAAGNRATSARKGRLVVEQFECPVRFLDVGVKFKCELNRINPRSNLFSRPREGNLVLEGNQPGLGEGGNFIPHRTRTAVELGRRGREKTAATKHDSLHVSDPV